MRKALLRKSLCLFLVLWVADAFAARERWWDNDWEYRRRLEVYARPSGFPGDDVAWVQFTGGGLVKDDGGDVRIVVPQARDLVPHKVLFVGPGDKVSVAFKVIPDQQYYWLYFGNPNAAPLESNWQIQRGCLLETRVFQGGDMNSWSGMQDILAKSGPLMGRGFVPKVWFGHNPFGPSVNNVNVFTGWLLCPQKGKYDFVTSSDDASFLRVDDRMVVSWPGGHGAVADIRHKGSVDLTEGLHKLEYYHVQAGGGQIMVAAWSVPGNNQTVVIPETAFAPVYRAVFVGFKSKARPGGMADFFAENAGEALLEGEENYLIRMKFNNWTPAGLRSTVRCEWDFGDGNSAVAISPEHVYFSRGVYTVRLTVGREENAFQAKVMVDRDWFTGQLSREIDSLESYLPLVDGYRWEAMPPPDLRNALLLFDRFGRTDKVLEIATLLLEPGRQIADGVRREVALRAAELHVAAGRPLEAARVLHAAVDAPGNAPAVQAELLLRAGAIEYEDLRDGAKATETFRRVVDNHSDLGGVLLRTAYIGLGDANRLRLRNSQAEAFDQSSALYDKAMNVKFEETNLEREQLLIAAASRAVDDYVARGELDIAWERLAEWKLRAPADALTGNWTVSYVGYLLARGKLSQAADECVLLVQVNPKSIYAPQALVLGARAYLALGKREDAKNALKDLTEDYPESALAARGVDELLRDLERKVSPKPQ
ncbi:MAG: PKD domain-containing protein [Planctomycetota bacterium]